MTCLYLPPSLSQDELFKILWEYGNSDIVPGDLNIRVTGANRSSISCRESFLQFAEECRLHIQEAGGQLDHLLSRTGVASKHLYTETNLATDHRQQSFTLHPQTELPAESASHYGV